LIAVQPKHPGGYDLLGKFYLQTGDHRQALALFRKAWEFVSPDYPGRVVLSAGLNELEGKARWEEKLPAVLRGELKPTPSELLELAGYCATFEKRFALASRFASEAITTDPKLLDHWTLAIRFVGWAIQAGVGHGVDAQTTPLAVREHYRRLALDWLREILQRRGQNAPVMVFYLNTIHDLAPLRDPQELAKLPAGERAAWEKLWADVGLAEPAIAPPPRTKK
jgi:eukaryotic-like serine/threonine-protein kinase